MQQTMFGRILNMRKDQTTLYANPTKAQRPKEASSKIHTIDYKIVTTLDAWYNSVVDDDKQVFFLVGKMTKKGF